MGDGLTGEDVTLGGTTVEGVLAAAETDVVCSDDGSGGAVLLPAPESFVLPGFAKFGLPGTGGRPATEPGRLIPI